MNALNQYLRAIMVTNPWVIYKDLWEKIYQIGIFENPVASKLIVFLE